MGRGPTAHPCSQHGLKMRGSAANATLAFTPSPHWWDARQLGLQEDLALTELASLGDALGSMHTSVSASTHRGADWGSRWLNTWVGRPQSLSNPRACPTSEPLQPHHHDALPSSRNDAPITQVPQTTQTQAINAWHKAKAGCAFILSPARFLYWEAGRRTRPAARAHGDSGRAVAVVWMQPEPGVNSRAGKCETLTPTSPSLPGRQHQGVASRDVLSPPARR